MNEDEADSRGASLPRPPAAWRPGTRLERVRNSHSYGFVLFLVIALMTFTALAPDTSWALAVVTLFEGGILCAALWTSGLPQARFVLPMIAVVSLVAVLAQVASEGSTTRGIVGGVEVAFLVGACGVIAAGVWDQQEVNQQSVLGALSIYLTIGMLFAVAYGAAADLGSGPFFAQGTDGSPATRLYFSFVTLATLGYGDYTPAQDVGRILAVAEALLGQLYLVTVIAVLVSNLGRER